MTIELQEALNKQMTDALDTGDTKQIWKAYGNILSSLMDCQRKTAERVKKLSWKVFAVVFSLGGTGGALISNIDKLKQLFIQ